MGNGKIKRKFTYREKVKILTIATLISVLVGVFIPLNYTMCKSYKQLLVTDIKIESELVSSAPVNLILIAQFPVVIDTSKIRTAFQIHRQTMQLHIWIAIYHPGDGGFMAITYTNETVQVVFPISGVWDIIAGEFSMEVSVS